MFDFMTSDMRKPLPETIEDLQAMNYTIVIQEAVRNATLKLNNELINGRMR
jgi:hypothetical protein